MLLISLLESPTTENTLISIYEPTTNPLLLIVSLPVIASATAFSSLASTLPVISETPTSILAFAPLAIAAISSSVRSTTDSELSISTLTSSFISPEGATFCSSLAITVTSVTSSQRTQ